MIKTKEGRDREMKAISGVIIKPNQAGTLTETVEAASVEDP